MKIRWVVLTFLLCAGIFSSSMIGYISGVRAYQKQIPSDTVSSLPPEENAMEASVSDSEEKPENLIQDFTETYVLKAVNGKMVLFIRYANGDEEFHSNYDVSVNLLPKSDRDRLSEGIELNTLKEALSLIEDYVG